MSHSPHGQTRTVVIITPEWVLGRVVGKHLSEIPDEQTIYGTHETCEELDLTAYVARIFAAKYFFTSSFVGEESERESQEFPGIPRCLAAAPELWPREFAQVGRDPPALRK